MKLFSFVANCTSVYGVMLPGYGVVLSGYGVVISCPFKVLWGKIDCFGGGKPWEFSI